MPAELIAVSGSLTGNRYALTSGEIALGRSPSAAIALADPDVSWRHCQIQSEDGRFRVRDLNTAAGTYVNGMRVTAHWLETGDQIAVGENVLVFRDVQPAEQAVSSRVTLLRACSLLFLFRGMASGQADALESHVLSLLSELAPCEAAAVLIGASEEELRTLAHERDSNRQEPDSTETPRPLSYRLERMVDQVLTEGPYADAATGAVAVPVYAAGVPRGAIVARFAEHQIASLEDHLEVLSAVSTLASAAIENVREVQALRTENAILQERLTADNFGIVGRSQSMKRLLQLAERVAVQDTTVLILGESGTGKELIARALHQGSPRRDKPFVAINCAAVTETLLESELFGHERGAFTGAVAQKKGKLESAEGGTVFLDEIGEMAPALQAKLLRVLQQREFERVGGNRTIPLNVRVVAATNRDLAGEVKKNRFREDLYHRLNVVALRTPPLRERPEDIPLLAEYFLRKSARRMGRVVTGMTPETERLLIRYSWPGNVRELENAMERAVVMTDTELLGPADLPEIITESVAPLPPGKTSYELLVGDARREAILRAWDEAQGDYKQAAALLGIHPNSLLRLVRKNGLREVLGRSTTAG